MSDVSKTVAPAAKPSTFEIKSAHLPLVALLLKTTHLAELATEWDQQFAGSPDFFDQEPLVIDLSPLAHTDGGQDIPDFKGLVSLLRQHRTCPVAVKGGTPEQMAAALAAGLVAAPDALAHKDLLYPEGPVGVPESVSPAPPPADAPPQALPALVIDKPLRSGQQVYARGRDLIVLSIVNAGAEVIADGDIHVYGTLRGKAIAGARGNADARIFALTMEAELISIAGIYRTSDVPLPADVKGHTAMVSLRTGPGGDKLVIEPLSH